MQHKPDEPHDDRAAHTIYQHGARNAEQLRADAHDNALTPEFHGGGYDGVGESCDGYRRTRAAKLAAENGTAGLLQSVISEVVLDEKGITLHAGSDEVTFLYGDYNYEDIDDTDCLPAVAQFLVQHLRGYYNISRTFYTVPKHNGRSITEKTRQVFIRRHHEDSPFDPTPTQKQRLF